jgi:hypothetical protein
MAKTQTSKNDDRRDLTRRALIKWSIAAGAALGVSKAKIFDILNDVGGSELAYAASTNAATRSVHIAAGNGGLAWFTQNFPFPDITTAAGQSYFATGQATAAPDTDNKYFIGPATPFGDVPGAQQMTAFLCGSNETHTNNDQSTVTLNGNNIFAVATALQSSTPSVIPVVTIGDVDLGTAPGAQRPANVGDANGIVGLFNSAASRMGGLLSQAKDADLYKHHFQAFWQLNRASNLSTMRTPFTTANGAAGFLGTNLASKLAITPADLTLYGVDGNTRASVANIANALIIATKAFKLGLTNSVVLPAFRDDPHGAFDGGDVNTVPVSVKKVLDGWKQDLMASIDSATNAPLWGDVVMTIHGDTFKNPNAPGGWGDGTPNNTNVVYVLGAGHLKTGWFGNMGSNGQATGFGADGKTAAYNGATTAKFATASIAYAIAKRDDRAIQQFANGIQVSGIFGRPKEV